MPPSRSTRRHSDSTSRSSAMCSSMSQATTTSTLSDASAMRVASMPNVAGPGREVGAHVSAGARTEEELQAVFRRQVQHARLPPKPRGDRRQVERGGEEAVPDRRTALRALVAAVVVGQEVSAPATDRDCRCGGAGGPAGRRGTGDTARDRRDGCAGAGSASGSHHDRPPQAHRTPTPTGQDTPVPPSPQ